jgi:hypothetical protein
MTAETPLYVSVGSGFNPASAEAILPVSAPVLTSPFTGVNIPYQLTQQFQCHASKYQPLALNTKWGTWAGAVQADYDGFILCSESPREPIGGQTVRWTRTYAKIPASYSLPASTIYPFVGFQSASGVNVQAQSGRDPFSDKASARVQYDYFLIDAVNGTKNGPIYNKSTNVPLIPKQRYYLNKDLVAFRIFTALLTSVGVDSNPTVPSIEDYLAWIAGGIEIVAENSDIDTWIGNIAVRKTVYIMPQ